MILYGYDGCHRLTGITHQVCPVSSGHSCSSTVAAGSDTDPYNDNRSPESPRNPRTVRFKRSLR